MLHYLLIHKAYYITYSVFWFTGLHPIWGRVHSVLKDIYLRCRFVRCAWPFSCKQSTLTNCVSQIEEAYWFLWERSEAARRYCEPCKTIMSLIYLCRYWDFRLSKWSFPDNSAPFPLLQVLKEDSVLLASSKRSTLDKCSLPAGIRIFVSAGHSDSDLLKASEALKRAATYVLLNHNWSFHLLAKV